MSTPLEQWVESVTRMTRPERIVWCDGSEEEYARIQQQSVREGHTLPLNPKTHPNCFLHRSNPNDVSRTEKVTFICTRDREDAGPTNNWMAPSDAKKLLGDLFSRLDERPYDVRRPVHYGTGGIAAEPPRGRGDRQQLCCRQHAHHDAHGQDSPGQARQLLRFRSRPSFPGRPESGPALHRPLPRRKTDLERRFGLRRKRVAREEVLCAAHRKLDGAGTRLDGRAHADPGPGIAIR